MPWLVPSIHVSGASSVDGRDKPGHDDLGNPRAATCTALILRSPAEPEGRCRASRRMAASASASWFETALTRLLTMRDGCRRNRRRLPQR
ncbi:hypothetical protein DY467_09770 [Rhodopseudomonas sp. BR0G17]|nr:hypothetical protein [Rhodopseudomonas sp. BR0G17]